MGTKSRAMNVQTKHTLTILLITGDKFFVNLQEYLHLKSIKWATWFRKCKCSRKRNQIMFIFCTEIRTRFGSYDVQWRIIETKLDGS